MNPEGVIPSGKRGLKANGVRSTKWVYARAEGWEDIGSQVRISEEKESEQVGWIRFIRRLGEDRALLNSDERLGATRFVADEVSCGEYVSLWNVDRQIVDVGVVASNDRSAQYVRPASKGDSRRIRGVIADVAVDGLIKSRASVLSPDRRGGR